MKEKNKLITFLIIMVLVLLIGLYYVIFIYDGGKNRKYLEDKEGSCNKINETIETKYKYYKDLYNKENIKYLSTYFYSIDPDNNILSLVIHFCGDDADKNYQCEFLIYNLDIKNNKVLTNQELLKLYNINNETVTDNSLIYLNESFKLVLITNTTDNFIEKVLD